MLNMSEEKKELVSQKIMEINRICLQERRITVIWIDFIVFSWLVKELLSALNDYQVLGLLKYFRIFEEEDGQRPPPPHPRDWKGKAQTQETSPKPQLLLHGRQVRRLQWDSRGLQPCPNHSGLQQLQEHSEQANRREVQADRRFRLQGQELNTMIPIFLISSK